MYTNRTPSQVIIGRWRKVMAVVVVGSLIALLGNLWLFAHMNLGG